MNLLINESPLQVLPSLAVKIGLNNAIVLQQIHYWLRISNNVRDGHVWVYKTMEEWAKEFPFWSKRTVERIIHSLEQSQLLVVGQYNKFKMDRTKWYRINYDKLEELCHDAYRQSDMVETDKGAETNTTVERDGKRQHDGMETDTLTRCESDKVSVPITKEYTKTTKESTTKKNRKRVYDESNVEYQLAQLLYEKILTDDPSFKQPNLESWSDHIRLMIERDKRTVEQIRYLINWSQTHPFWKSHILSTEKLREKATTLIRQIKAEKERPVTREYKNSRTEHVPAWLDKHKQMIAPASVKQSESIDFEAERQKMLAKLGYL